MGAHFKFSTNSSKIVQKICPTLRQSNIPPLQIIESVMTLWHRANKPSSMYYSVTPGNNTVMVRRKTKYPGK